MAASALRTEFAVAGRTGYKPAPTPMKIPVKVYQRIRGEVLTINQYDSTHKKKHPPRGFNRS